MCPSLHTPINDVLIIMIMLFALSSQVKASLWYSSVEVFKILFTKRYLLAYRKAKYHHPLNKYLDDMEGHLLKRYGENVINCEH